VFRIERQVFRIEVADGRGLVTESKFAAYCTAEERDDHDLIHVI